MNGSPQLGFSGFRIHGHDCGLVSTCGPNSNFLPSNLLCGSISRSSVVIGSLNASDQGCADSCARCSGDSEQTGDRMPLQLTGGGGRHPVPQLRQVVARDAPVKDAIGVVDLAVADEVD